MNRNIFFVHLEFIFTGSSESADAVNTGNQKTSHQLRKEVRYAVQKYNVYEKDTQSGNTDIKISAHNQRGCLCLPVWTEVLVRTFSSRSA
ncbi:hypothetical protein [Desulfovibrio sp. JC010]|uniref:hypothetical protein n=1 Tax=Desulfovibrio sp. JC010 TaxID=2593641 RepID=UPI00193FDE0B|nr:hypothetical protein [Desulfovibrio sp. JC010]